MDGSSWSKETLELKDLSLWDENARFPDKYFSKTEEELIQYFLSKKDFKVVDLAKEIVGELDIPQLERLVVLRQDDRNIVIEGNRRLTVYKLLANPSLTQTPAIKTEFEQLALQAGIDESFKLDALITDEKSEGLRIVERKHLKSNNEVGWGDSERAHYSARKGEADKQTMIKVEVAKKVKETGLDESLLDQVLGRGFVTTFQRIMTGSAASEAFGYNLDKDGKLDINDPDFLDKLKVVIWNVLQKKGYDGADINSRSLNTTKQIKDYLSGINKEAVDEAQKAIEDSRSKNLLGEETVTVTTSQGQRSVPRSAVRKFLIPKTCILQIDNQKINNIYHELRDTLLIDDTRNSSPNATGVLFRVFLETSLDWYLEQNGTAPKENDKISAKIPKVVALLKTNAGATDQQMASITKVGSSQPSTSILAIDNFHQYVHSSRKQPGPTDLKQCWDELQEFFVILWTDLHKRHTEKSGKK